MAIEEENKTADESSADKKTSVHEEDDLFAESDPEDALLVQVLRQYDDVMLDRFFNDEDDEKPVPLSREGREKMKDLLGQWIGTQQAEQVLKKEEKQYRRDLHRWRQRRRQHALAHVPRLGIAAAAVLAVIIISTVTGNNSLAFKLPEVAFEAVVGSERTRLLVSNGQYLDSTENETELNSSIDVYYKLGKVLNGYTLQDCIINSVLCMYIYGNKSAHSYYTFTQQLEKFNIGVNTEKNVTEKVETLYGEGYFYSYNNEYGLVWTYNDYMFRIEGNLTKEDLLELQSYLIQEK